VTDYGDLLRRRSKHAQPRALHEAVATHLQERNAAALAAWRVRWALRLRLPDALTPNGRALMDAHFTLLRRQALAWLWKRTRKTGNVLVLRSGR
jgi:hypothetical protein